MKEVSTPFSENFLDDESLNKKSVLVPDDIKAAIKKWAKDMKLDETRDKIHSSRDIPISMKKVTVNELKKIVNDTISQERNNSLLREEIFRIFGPVVNTDIKIELMAEEANDRLNVIERTGKRLKESIKPSLLMKFSSHPSSEVRKLIVRLLPENLVERFASDKSNTVLYEVAKRLPLREARALAKRHPGDKALYTIYRDRYLLEVAEDLKAGEILKGAVSCGPAIDELSVTWYKTEAAKVLRDYGVSHGGPIENGWDEVFVKRYCASLKDTTGISCDPDRLYKAIQDQIIQRDNKVLKANELTVESKSSSNPFERKNIVENLLKSNLGSLQFVNEFDAIFNTRVMEENFQNHKYRLIENSYLTLDVPVSAKIPAGYKFSSTLESVFDRYVNSWNNVQAQRGSHVRIDWMPHPKNLNYIQFLSRVS